MEKCRFDFIEFYCVFEPVFKDAVNEAFLNYEKGLFEIYRNESLHIIVEFNRDKKEMLIVAQIGINSAPVWDEVFKYLKSIGYDAVFKVFKPSQLRLQRRFNPVHIGNDGELNIYKVFTNG